MNHSNIKYRDALVLRGDLYYADLSPVVGSEQGGLRPVLVVQNNTGNRHSPTIIVAAITSRTTKAKLPTHVPVSRQDSGLKCDSTILLEQVRTIDRCRLKEYIGQLPAAQMAQADQALLTSFGLNAVNAVAFSQSYSNSTGAMQKKAAPQDHTSIAIRTAAPSCICSMQS